MVDDEPKNLLALETVLTPLGQNLLPAQSGEEALRFVLKHNVAVILLDVRMPEMDGFETARMIRKRERSRHIPIIFLTGEYTEVESAFRGYELGAVDYLIKPLVPEILRSKTSVFIELHKKNAALINEINERKIAEERLQASEERLRGLAAHLNAVREDERSRIAREIHDEFGQALSGLKMDVIWLAKRLSENQRPLVEKTETMCRLIDSTVQLIRRISTGLRPEVLDELGLVAAISWQAKEFQKRMGIRCQIKLPKDHVILDGNLSTAVFRIFQEILTNIARHANANRVQVDLETFDHYLTLKVVDDGVGILESEVRGRKSLGLLGMQERAQEFGGELSILRTPGGGTTVSVSMPMPRFPG